jgi:hypothetical protein
MAHPRFGHSIAFASRHIASGPGVAGLSGSIQIAPDGTLTGAEEREGFTPIVETRVDGSVLHITGEDRATTSDATVDRIQLDLAITGRDRGEIRVTDGPVKPWPVRRQ